MSILVLNAGSSTLKFSLFDDCVGEQLASGIVTLTGGDPAATKRVNRDEIEQTSSEADVGDDGDAVAWILRLLKSHRYDEPIHAVGHRVVHGGPYKSPSLIRHFLPNFRCDRSCIRCRISGTNNTESGGLAFTGSATLSARFVLRNYSTGKTMCHSDWSFATWATVARRRRSRVDARWQRPWD